MEENKFFDMAPTKEQEVNTASEEVLLPEGESIAEDSLLSDAPELLENEVEVPLEESSESSENADE